MIDIKFKLLLPDVFFTKKSLVFKEFLKSLDEVIDSYYEFKSTHTSEFVEIAFNKQIPSVGDIIEYILKIRSKDNLYISKVNLCTSNIIAYTTLYMSDNYKETWLNENKSNLDDVDKLISKINNAISLFDSVKEKINKQNNVLNKDDFDKDGMPRLSRGCLCRYYIPIKGLTNNETEKIICFNPRSKNNVEFKIIKIKDDGNAYEVINILNNKKYWITSYDNINNAWDALFNINKDIFGGWWNKTLIKI